MKWKYNDLPEVMLLKRFKKHLDRVKELIGVDYSRATWVKYRSCYRHMKSFLKDNYNTNDMLITKFNLDTVETLEHYMKTKLDLAHNTAIKYIFVVKKIILDAYKKEVIKNNPFEHYTMNYKTKDPVYLSWEELKAIEEKEFASGRLRRVQDVFIFCCYTGLAFSDADSLSYSHFFEDQQGDMWLIKEREKTKEPSRILLLPKPKKIYEKYREDKGNAWIEESQVLPTISNTKTNEYLKEIADLCGIDKRLTTHVARHTFATTVTLENGSPIESVQKMMGHKSRRSTEHYARATTSKLGAEMKNLRKRLN